MKEYVALVEWHRQGKSKVLREKPVSVTLHLPKIWHGTGLGPNPDLRNKSNAITVEKYSSILLYVYTVQWELSSPDTNNKE